MATLLHIIGRLLSKPLPRLFAFLLFTVLIAASYHSGISTMPTTRDFYLPYIGIVPGQLIDFALPGSVYIGALVAFVSLIALEVHHHDLRKIGVKSL